MSEENKTPRTIRKTLDRKFGVSESREERRPRRDDRTGDDREFGRGPRGERPRGLREDGSRREAVLANAALIVNVVRAVLTTSPLAILTVLAARIAAVMETAPSVGLIRLASLSIASVRNRSPRSMPTRLWMNLCWKPV